MVSYDGKLHAPPQRSYRLTKLVGSTGLSSRQERLSPATNCGYQLVRQGVRNVTEDYAIPECCRAYFNIARTVSLIDKGFIHYLPEFENLPRIPCPRFWEHMHHGEKAPAEKPKRKIIKKPEFWTWKQRSSSAIPSLKAPVYRKPAHCCCYCCTMCQNESNFTFIRDGALSTVVEETIPSIAKEEQSLSKQEPNSSKKGPSLSFVVLPSSVQSLPPLSPSFIATASKSTSGRAPSSGNGRPLIHLPCIRIPPSVVKWESQPEKDLSEVHEEPSDYGSLSDFTVDPHRSFASPTSSSGIDSLNDEDIDVTPSVPNQMTSNLFRLATPPKSASTTMWEENSSLNDSAIDSWVDRDAMSPLEPIDLDLRCVELSNDIQKINTEAIVRHQEVEATIVSPYPLEEELFKPDKIEDVNRVTIHDSLPEVVQRPELPEPQSTEPLPPPPPLPQRLPTPPPKKMRQAKPIKKKRKTLPPKKQPTPAVDPIKNPTLEQNEVKTLTPVLPPKPPSPVPPTAVEIPPPTPPEPPPPKVQIPPLPKLPLEPTVAVSPYLEPSKSPTLELQTQSSPTPECEKTDSPPPPEEKTLLPLHQKDADFLAEIEKAKLAEERRLKALMLFKKVKKKASFATVKMDEFVSVKEYGWLPQFCIIKENYKRMYRAIFDTVDENGDGYLNCFETILALKGITNLQNLTEKEEEYIYRILEIADYNIAFGTDFRLFSIIAALAQKVVSVDDWVKNIIEKIDLEMLDWKIYRAKELFQWCLDEHTNRLSVKKLMIELKAGGVSQEHQDEAGQKFGQNDTLDLLDFLTYLPLFIMTHKSVVKNPLCDERDK